MLSGLPPERQEKEIVDGERAIERALGHRTWLFRPPYGEYDARVVRVAAEVGLTTVEYDLPSGDPDPRISTAALVDWVLRLPSEAIVHDGWSRAILRDGLAGVLPEKVRRRRWKVGFTTPETRSGSSSTGRPRTASSNDTVGGDTSISPRVQA